MVRWTGLGLGLTLPILVGIAGCGDHGKPPVEPVEHAPVLAFVDEAGIPERAEIGSHICIATQATDQDANLSVQEGYFGPTNHEDALAGSSDGNTYCADIELGPNEFVSQVTDQTSLQSNELRKVIEGYAPAVMADAVIDPVSLNSSMDPATRTQVPGLAYFVTTEAGDRLFPTVDPDGKLRVTAEAGTNIRVQLNAPGFLQDVVAFYSADGSQWTANHPDSIALLHVDSAGVAFRAGMLEHEALSGAQSNTADVLDWFHSNANVGEGRSGWAAPKQTWVVTTDLTQDDLDHLARQEVLQAYCIGANEMGGMRSIRPAFFTDVLPTDAEWNQDVVVAAKLPLGFEWNVGYDHMRGVPESLANPDIHAGIYSFRNTAGSAGYIDHFAVLGQIARDGNEAALIDINGDGSQPSHYAVSRTGEISCLGFNFPFRYNFPTAAELAQPTTQISQASLTQGINNALGSQ